MVGALTLIQEDNEVQHIKEATAQAEACWPKTVSEKFPFTSQGLWVFCGTATNVGLSEFCPQFATGTKHKGPQLLQQLLCNWANEQASTKVYPIITPALSEPLSKFSYVVHNLDDLTEGLSIFLVVVRAGQQAKDAEQLMMCFSMMYSGHMAPDEQSLIWLTVATPNMPKTPLKLLKMYQAYGTLLDVVYGTNHPKSISFHTVFLPSFESKIEQLEENITDDVECQTVLQGCMQHTQLASAAYDLECNTLGPANASPPEFHELNCILLYQQY
jgi:hypothetical protein